MTDQTLRLPRPDDTLHDVGPDTEWLGRAKRQLQLLEYWGFTPASDLLEIGSGVGRLAYELATFLDTGSYTGFDISEPAIKWLNENYAPKLPNFRFDLIDVRNARYRPKKGKSAEKLKFRYADDSFDFACSFAVFMHMMLPEIANYLAETRRVLRPGGRAVLTMTAITADDRALPSLPVLGNQKFVPIGEGIYAKRPDRPTFGLAFDEELLRKVAAQAGLDVIEFTPGTWRSPTVLDAPIATVGGDVFVLTPA